jgi:4-amino-4-deoxy-L-arabinose transferase-like glycosyltransferase
MLYPEALAIPLTLGLLLLLLTREPTRRRATGFGLLLGVTLLVRPTSEFILLGVLVVWSLRLGWRRGFGLTVLAAVVAALVVAPWTIRNAIVLHGFVPISMQDMALYGTFNADAANDPVNTYEWRDQPREDYAILHPSRPVADVKVRSELINQAETYISDHPTSLFGAFYWNGVRRFWDIRGRSQSGVEVAYEGRSGFLNSAGLDMYDVLLPLALVGLWRARRRRWLVLGVAATALGASIVFTVEAGTRYRAPLEPLIAVLACAGVMGARDPGLAWDDSGDDEPARA